MATLAFHRQSPGATRAVVCVHGIFSSHHTFVPLFRVFEASVELANWDLAWFDYDFHQELWDSGRQLAEALQRMDARYTTVVLVAHSMGGLVSRMAILDRRLDRVTRLIMFGTPNCGAVRTASLAILAQVAFNAAGKLYGLFSRRTGVRDLTRVTRVFRMHRGNAANADHVEYVTIPGLFFYLERDIFEMLPQKAFSGLEIAGELLDAMGPLFRVRLQRPHDGIVEESSVCLVPSEPGSRWSEKQNVINNPDLVKAAAYGHLHHDRCEDLTHVDVHADPVLLALTARLVGADSLEQWRRGWTPDELRTTSVRP
jgi:pimeloyl-ACP methyl ester carboxylesterase